MKNVKSLIEELDSIVPERSKHQIVEARAQNAIASCMNLMQLIAESFDQDIAEDLNKRLLSSIKNKDPNKFLRKVKEIQKRSK